MQGCRSVLLMLVMRMMVVLVVLMVLEELVVFVYRQFKKNKNIIESKKKSFGAKKTLNSLRQSQKSTFTLELYIAVFPL